MIRERRQDVDGLILGGGPAGLICAHELASHGWKPELIEKNESVGGLCRTVESDGFLFDIGGHRFLSADSEVNALWKDVLGDDLLTCERRSRIFYRNRFFAYPLRLAGAMWNLGLAEAMLCAGSYVFARLARRSPPRHFEDWMIRRFGRRLYRNFFQSYTEKVWGISCRDLSSDWADQRIQKLSLGKALLHAFFRGNVKGAKTLSESFHYPRRGPGQFYDRLKDRAIHAGADIHLRTSFESMKVGERAVESVTVRDDQGWPVRYQPGHVFSSLPLTMLIQSITPAPPAPVLTAARSLEFRSFISVNLIFREEKIFDDQWIYIHSPGLKVGRIQNYGNWSPDMVPQKGFSSLGMEYFVGENDPIWRLREDKMVRYALNELMEIGLVGDLNFIRGFTVKVPYAYPVYGRGYVEAVATIKEYLSRFSNLHLMGRAGLFRYNNSDHALLTGLAAARRVLGKASEDPWIIDPDRAGGCEGLKAGMADG